MMKDNFLVRRVCDIYARFRLRKYLYLFKKAPPHALKPIYNDLWRLYRLVRLRRPKIIFEFGSGHSTLIMVKALEENGYGYLYSFDHNNYWKKSTEERLGYTKRGEIRYAPLTEMEYLGTPVFKHTAIPNLSVDFLYLDSPPLTHITVAIDPIELEKNFTEDFMMLVDGRLDNMNFLKKLLKNKYKFNYNRILEYSTFRRL